MRAIRHLERTKQSAAGGRCAVVVTLATVIMVVVTREDGKWMGRAGYR